MTPERKAELRRLMEMYAEGDWVELVSDDVLQLLDAIGSLEQERDALKAKNERLRAFVSGHMESHARTHPNETDCLYCEEWKSALDGEAKP